MEFHPGDSIFLKRGDVWNESFFITSSGKKGNPILISAYGTGEMPFLNGATPVKDWSIRNDGILMSGYNGICRGLLEDGKPLKRATSATLKDGQWFYNGGIIFYRSTREDTDVHLVERCARGALLTIKEKEYLIVDGITFYGANSFGIRLIDCSNIVIRNCKVTANGQDGISIQRQKSELSFEGIKIHKNIINWNANGIYVWGKDGGFNSSGYRKVEIIENVVKFNNHNNSWGHNTKDGHAIGMQNSSFCRIEGNILTDNFSGIALWTADIYESRNNVITRNFIARNHLYGLAHGANGKNNSYNNIFSYNIIVGNGHWYGKWGGLRINRRQESGNYYYNNTLSDNDINIYLYSFPDFHIIKNNISLNPINFHVWLDDSAGLNNLIDNNCYYPAVDNSFYSKFTEDADFIDWQKRARQDSHSIVLNPLIKLAKPVNPKDFCLTVNSPCIGRATLKDDAYQKDYLGNKSKDIGACGFIKNQ